MDPLIGRTLRTFSGTYQLEAPVSRGRFTVTYHGHTVESGDAVEVTILVGQHARNRRVANRFEQEARLARGLRHPNVVEVLDQGRDTDGRPFAVTARADGWSAAMLLRRSTVLPTAEALSLARQALEGLEAARLHGVCHGGLTPRALLVTPDGCVKVSGLGIAHDGALAAAAGELTAPSEPSYAAPEALRGDAVDARADLYAVGAILYEVLAGEPPGVDAESRQDVASLVDSLAERRPDLPSSILEIVRSALAPAPTRRYADAGVMARALGPSAPARMGALPAGEGGDGAGPLEPDNLEPLPSPCRAGPRLTLSGALVSGLALLALAWVWLPHLWPADPPAPRATPTPSAIVRAVDFVPLVSPAPPPAPTPSGSPIPAVSLPTLVPATDPVIPTPTAAFPVAEAPSLPPGAETPPPPTSTPSDVSPSAEPPPEPLQPAGVSEVAAHYYALVNGRQFQDAYALSSTRRRQEILRLRGSVDGWRAYVDRVGLVAFEIGNLTVTSQTDTRVTLTGLEALRYRDHRRDARVSRTITLVREDGEWRIDRIV